MMSCPALAPGIDVLEGENARRAHTRSFPRKRESRAKTTKREITALGPRFRGDERKISSSLRRLHVGKATVLEALAQCQLLDFASRGDARDDVAGPARRVRHHQRHRMAAAVALQIPQNKRLF